MASIMDVLELQEEGAGHFIAPAVPSQISRTFGGQVVVQALRAAQVTVSEKQVHSLHSYFLRPGDSSSPMSLQVETVRDGRSFAARQVRASQHGKLIFILSASFHLPGEQGPEHADPAPEVPGPQEAVRGGGGKLHSPRIILPEWQDWDIRLIPEPGRDSAAAERTGSGFRYIWFRYTGAVPAEQSFHQAGLAYMSDMTLIRSALIEHQGVEVQLASLDHCMWFFRPIHVDEWLLYEQVSPAAGGGTGLAQGKLYNRAGELVAMTMQEGLMRTVEKPLRAGGAHGNWQDV